MVDLKVMAYFKLSPSTRNWDSAFYFRQLRDVKISAIIEGWDAELLSIYGTLCARVLARAHARSGDAGLIAGYMGSSQSFDESICEFAVEYADQVRRDYREFVKAVHQGRLEALRDPVKPVAHRQAADAPRCRLSETEHNGRHLADNRDVGI